MLAALGARVARAPALPARRADEAAGARTSPSTRGFRSPASPTRRTCASWPAPAATAFLARHGGLRERAGRHRRRGGRACRPPPRPHAYTVGQRRGLGVGGTPSRSTSTRTDARANTVTVGPRAALRRDATSARAIVRLHRAAGRGRRSVKLRYRSRRRLPVPRCASGAGSSSHEPAWGVAPGQTAVLLHGDRRRWDARRSPHEQSDLGRDPRDLPRVLRAARPPAPPVGLARARRRSTRRCCSRPPGCTRSSRYFLGLETAARDRADELPEVLSHAPTSRTSATPRAT